MQTTIPPIRVLFLSAWYPNKTDTMFGLFVKRHAQCISAYADVSVLYIHPHPTLKINYEVEINSDGKLKKIIVYYKSSTSKIPLISSGIKLYRYLTAYCKGLNTIKKEFGHFDLIHTNILTRTGVIAYLLHKFLRKPYIITEHWSRYLPITNTYKGVLRKWLTKIVVKNASAVVPVSKSLKDAMLSNHLYNTNYHIIHNCVDTSMFHPVTKKTSPLKTILHVSCFEDRSKNISGILRILKKLSTQRTDFVCRLIGDGIDKPAMEKLAQELGIYNTFAIFEGLKENENLIRIYQESDFFLLFSHYENMPVVIAEALSCGLPIIATSAGGIVEIVNKTNGILVNPNDENALLDSIITMIHNHSMYDKNKLHLEAVNLFDNKIIGKKYLEIYKNVLKGE